LRQHHAQLVPKLRAAARYSVRGGLYLTELYRRSTVRYETEPSPHGAHTATSSMRSRPTPRPHSFQKADPGEHSGLLASRCTALGSFPESTQNKKTWTLLEMTSWTWQVHDGGKGSDP